MFFLISQTDCGLLDDPTDGTVTYSNSATTYQEVATFSCDTGFDLIGDVTRTCMDDGMWGGASPFCQIKGNVFHKDFQNYAGNIHKDQLGKKTQNALSVHQNRLNMCHTLWII